MTRKRLKNWVLPVLGVIFLLGLLLFYYIMNNIIEYGMADNPAMITDPIKDDTIVVNNEVEEKEPLKVIKPFTKDNVEISKFFYNVEDTEERQVKSLIKYSTIYMPNTGILYTSDESFDVVSVLDGKVSSIKTDEILGNIIELEHDHKIITIYQSVTDVQVSVGDKIKQGTIIAKSGSNKLEETKDNCLHFESYKDGSLINPEDLYNLDINSLD